LWSKSCKKSWHSEEDGQNEPSNLSRIGNQYFVEQIVQEELALIVEEEVNEAIGLEERTRGD
jgi:hypothetical protein